MPMEMEMEMVEESPRRGKMSPASCLGKRVLRPYCRCCGGDQGVRAAFRRNENGKHKTLRDHRR